MEYTEIQLRNWANYEAVRASGFYNMFSSRAQEATGLTREEYVFCIEHFEALEKAYQTAEDDRFDLEAHLHGHGNYE